MSEHVGDRRGYFHFRSAWYGKPEYLQSDIIDIVSFGYYAPDQSSSGELSMVWYEVQSTPTPRLEVFCDAWPTFALLYDVIAALAAYDEKNMSPEQFIRLLSVHGFVDLTPHQRSGR
jgi:hypothetical protein